MMGRRSSHPFGLSLSKPPDSRFRGNDKCGSSERQR